jgi:S1-C subfamily serine protease
MKKIVCCTLIMLGCDDKITAQNIAENARHTYEADMVATYSDSVVPAAKLNETELSTRAAAVKVFTPGMGRGSGCYVNYKGTNLVITAAHVIRNSKTNWFWIVNNKQKVKAHAVYFNDSEDIALLAIPDAKVAKSVPLTVQNTYPAIGEEIIYSGWPGHHSLLTIRGEVVGYQKISGGKEKLVVHTYGWPGASGSCFFNAAGEIVGVLVALPVERGYVPQLLESMMYATPIKHLDLARLDDQICTLPENLRPEMCKK